jgi:tellurite resistance protein TehA-like permease
MPIIVIAIVMSLAIIVIQLFLIPIVADQLKESLGIKGTKRTKIAIFIALLPVVGVLLTLIIVLFPLLKEMICCFKEVVEEDKKDQKEMKNKK